MGSIQERKGKKKEGVDDTNGRIVSKECLCREHQKRSGKIRKGLLRKKGHITKQLSGLRNTFSFDFFRFTSSLSGLNEKSSSSLFYS